MGALKEPYKGCLFFSSNALARRLMRMAEEAFMPVELTPTQSFILMSIGRRPGVTITQLALELRLDVSTISRAMDKMKVRGLLYSEQKGRATRLFPLPEGSEKIADVRAAWKKLKIRYSARIGEDITADLASRIISVDDAITMLDR
jgi:DNA-binding MarR family transcriptional regulator